MPVSSNQPSQSELLAHLWSRVLMPVKCSFYLFLFSDNPTYTPSFARCFCGLEQELWCSKLLHLPHFIAPLADLWSDVDVLHTGRLLMDLTHKRALWFFRNAKRSRAQGGVAERALGGCGGAGDPHWQLSVSIAPPFEGSPELLTAETSQITAWETLRTESFGGFNLQTPSLLWRSRTAGVRRMCLMSNLVNWLIWWCKLRSGLHISI